MPGRSGPLDRGRDRGDELSAYLRREFRLARLDRGLTQREIGRALGLSQSEDNRFERGEIGIDLARFALLSSLVGLELRVQLYPAGPPVRDRPHVALLERLHARCDARLRCETEVALPRARDPRGWDAVVWSPPPDGWAVPVEAEDATEGLAGHWTGA